MKKPQTKKTQTNEQKKPQISRKKPKVNPTNTTTPAIDQWHLKRKQTNIFKLFKTRSGALGQRKCPSEDIALISTKQI